MTEKAESLKILTHLLESYQPLKPTLRDAILEAFTIKTFAEKCILLSEGNICRDLFFIVDGVVRAFHFIGEEEKTSRLMFDNHIVIAPGSFFKQKPSIESLETMKESRIAIMSFTNLQKIYTQFPEFNYHTRLITEHYFYLQEQRLYMLRQESALEKYRFFVENYSQILRYIPQKYIASFLDIGAETLSRVRKRISKE